MMADKGSSTKLDMGVLTAEQRDKLRQFKIKTRIDNEKYLRSHPEVEKMISDFVRDVLLKRPSDICAFAADHFTRTIPQGGIGSKMEGNRDNE